MANEHIPQEGLRRINVSYDPKTDTFTNTEEVLVAQEWQDSRTVQVQTPTTKENLFADDPLPAIESSVVYHPEPEQTKQHEVINKQSKPDKNEKRRRRTFLRIGAAAVALVPLYYVSDVAATYIKDGEVVSPAEAYDDFINLPSLVTVITESIIEDKIDETVENITGGKE